MNITHDGPQPAQGVLRLADGTRVAVEAGDVIRTDGTSIYVNGARVGSAIASPPDPEDLAAVVLADIREAGLTARLMIPTGARAHYLHLMCAVRPGRVVPVPIGRATSLDEALAMLPDPYASAVRGAEAGRALRGLLAALGTDDERRLALSAAGFCSACGTDMKQADGSVRWCHCENDD